MDPVSNVERMVKLALTIKDAVDTVRENKELCHDIKTRAVRVSALLSRLPAELMEEPEMRGALEDLEESLRRALELVAACQEKSTACLLCNTGKQSKRLRKAQDDISQNVMTVVFATNVQVTVILTTNPPPPPPPPPPVLNAAAVDEEDGVISEPDRLGYQECVHIEQPYPPTHGTIASTSFPDPAYVPKAKPDPEYVRKAKSVLAYVPKAKPDPEYFRKAKSSTSSVAGSGLTKFNLSELDTATRHFSDDNLIGRDSFAAVYKGEMPNGLIVAVKKFQHPFPILMTIIHNEIHLFSEFQHQNLVKFIGYALEEKDYFLVEEYMSGGSLNDIIVSPPIWSSLFQIILGTAYGLHYLHDQHFIHLDLKPSNILLDSDMNPKITTIGMATVLGQGDQNTIRDVNTVSGTLGYMAPEYIMGGTLSTKCDVYSFGVILLQIVSSMCKSQPTHAQSSIKWAWVSLSTTVSFNPSFYEGAQLKEIKRCIEVGLLCTQFKPEDRPIMSDILEMLSGKKRLPMAKKPRYVKGRS